MAKRDLKLPDDFEASVRALLGTPPAARYRRKPEGCAEAASEAKAEGASAKAISTREG